MEVKKKILVLGINCLPELTGIGKYTGEMITWLADQGHEVTMVTAFPYYPQWKVEESSSNRFYKKEILQNGKLKIYRCPLYVPSSPTGLKRLIHEISFFMSSFFVLFRLLFKPRHDVFFSIAPPFHLGFLALFYRFFKRTPIVYHIQDLQIEAAKELNMLPSPLFSMLFSMERFILNSVNIVTTISEGMKRKIVKKTKRNVTLFPNWVDTFEFHPVVGRNELKLRWGFLPNDKIVLYSGSIGEKQGLDALIRIAHELKSYSDIKFIICGTGPFKNNLVQLTADLMLQNVHFLPLQGKDVFNDFLNIGDIHIVLQKADASDLVMPSKLTTILSIGGLALITANLGTTLCDVVLTHQMGVVVIPEDENVLKEAILKCCNGDFSLERANARKYAETNLNKDNILTKMVNNI